MATSEDDHVPVRDGHHHHPRHTAPGEMYWLSHMNQEELKERYVKLKDDFFTIKKFSCKQEDKIKKLQTKLRKLIADRKKDGGGLVSSVSRIQELEHQEIVDTQRQTIREMKIKNEHLEKKLKLANVQLSAAKKNKPMLFRNVGPRVDSGLKHTRTIQNSHQKQPPRPKSSPPRVSASDDSSGFLSPESVQQVDQMLPERVREILEEARERILGLEAERDDLQEQISDMQQTMEDSDYEWQQKFSAVEEEVTSLRQDLRDRGIREERDSVAIIRAQREAHTLTARSTALQEQLVVTEEKVVAEKSRTTSLQGELERTASKLTSSESQLKEQFQEVHHLKGQLQQINEKYSILKRENEQLEKENQHLTKLRLANDQRGQTAEVESLKLQIAQLESALASDLNERGVFLERMTKDKEEMAKLEVEAKELRTKNLELQEQLQKVKQKLELYDKAGLLNLTQKEIASATAKEKESNASGLSNEEIEKLKQSYSELQLLYREKNLELERTSQTLACHATTYKGLQAEIERVKQESEEKSQSLSSTIKNLQDSVKRRDERSEKLEHQILMLTDKSIKDKLEGLSHDLTQNVKLSKHDNMLEFHIESVTYEAGDFSQLKTFVSWTVPFSLEDPLQHTNVAIGKFAHFNYSSLYKFQMNYRNLESLRDDAVTVSVYILLESGHPAKVGECQLTFCEVLEHPRNTLHGTVPVVVAHDDADEVQHLPPQLQLQIGQVIGTLSYWFRLQRPCEKIISQHLQNVGALSSIQHREDQLPQTITSMIKSENPVASKHLKKVPTSSDHTPAAPEDRRADEHKEVKAHAASTSEQHSQDLGSSKGRKQSEVIMQEQVSVDKTRKSSRSSYLHQKVKKTSRMETEKILRKNTGKEVAEKEPSEPSSLSSTGTYNVGSPLHGPVGSPSSTGTYNVESPTRKQSDNRPFSSLSNHPVVGRDFASPESQFLLEDQQVTSPKSSSSEETQLSQGRVASVAPPKPPRTYAMEKDKVSEDSRRLSMERRKQVLTAGEASSEESLHTESEGNNTMFEESASSDSSEESAHARLQEEGVRREGGHGHSSHTDTKGPNVRKVIQSRQVQQLRSESRSEVGSHRGNVPFSPSRSSVTSDSDGVVAVVPRKSRAENSKIYVEICSLTLLEDSTVVQDPLVEFLFVDYHGFLDLPPDQLETPQSLPKPPPGCSLNFNFGQEFGIDERTYPSRKEALRDMMRNRGLIKFTVTSEPPEELQDTHDCQDLGYAFVNLHDLLKERRDLEEEDLVVENADDGSEMGTLRITLRILHVLRDLDM